MRATGSWGPMLSLIVIFAGAHAGRAQSVTAATLEQRAAAAITNGHRLSAAATLYRQAARCLPADDPRAIEDLRLAGLLYASSGQPEKASAAMERSAEEALASGRTDAAVEAFTNAALIEMGRHPDRAAVLAHRALWLADHAGASTAARAVARARLGARVAAAVSAA